MSRALGVFWGGALGGDSSYSTLSPLVLRNTSSLVLCYMQLSTAFPLPSGYTAHKLSASHILSDQVLPLETPSWGWSLKQKLSSGLNSEFLVTFEEENRLCSLFFSLA